jgi:copper(I)-binding protein
MRQFFATLAIATLMLATGASAHELTHKDIKIVHPWVPETEAVQVALRVTLRNSGQKAERLLRASTPIATQVTIVGTPGKDKSAISIPARGELVLKSDGPQILLSGLKKPLRAYDDFDVTFVFERAGPVKVDVIVEEVIAPDKTGGG